MSAFPGPGAQVYYNEAGEPLGWDYPGQDDPWEPDEDREERYFRDEPEDPPEIDYGLDEEVMADE